MFIVIVVAGSPSCNLLFSCQSFLFVGVALFLLDVVPWCCPVVVVVVGGGGDSGSSQ